MYWLVALLCFVCAEYSLAAELPSAKPAADDPSKHAFPALGSVRGRKVQVEWNRYYDHAGLGAILAKLHEAFPEVTRLYSVGKSVEGRDLWCFEITSQKRSDSKRKPGMYIDGNIHGNEVQAGEVVCYTAWYLCHQYGRLAEVTDLLDHNVFYLIPTINPDGRDRWFHHAQTMHSSRTGLKPYDNDRDGAADEDDVDDLNGDGSITQMRIKDPNGRWKPNPEFPDYFMVQAAPDERGEYTLLGDEGLDNDGDGKVNEDAAGGYDMNRNWAWDWQPNYIQYGSQDFPFSLPETRALSEFVIAHPNIGAGQSFHNNGGMMLRPPGREGGQMHGSDDQVFRAISERGEKMLPYYRSMITWKDLYTVWGGETDWHYGALGMFSFVNELWSMRNINKTGSDPSAGDQVAFAKYVLLNDGVVKWHEYDHATYGKIEIGGKKKEWGRTPPSFLLEEECHRNMAFTLYHAAQLPRLNISQVKIEKLQDGLYNIWVTIENQRLIPTRSAQNVRNNITTPDILSLRGDQIKVLSAGRVTDPYFNRVDAVKLRPERVEVDTVTGLGVARVQFIVSGSGKFKITVDSVRGGVLESEQTLP
ncbi:MAG: M14 family metallopeptidase [Verrucomicrobiales bacterium]|nr:M14 family metallopeptidase [Verrucomicrobiales bacterium]